MRKYSYIFIFLIFGFFVIAFQASAKDSGTNWFILGGNQLGSVLSEVVQSDTNPDGNEFLSTDTDDLRISMSNVQISNRVLEFALTMETSGNLNQSDENNNEPYRKSKTFTISIP